MIDRKRRRVLAASSLLVTCLSGCFGILPGSSETPTPRASTPTETATATATPSPTETPTPIPAQRFTVTDHTLAENPSEGFAEGDIRADGAYGLITTHHPKGGTFLLEITENGELSVAHHIDSQYRCMDVKFGSRPGLYMRSQGIRGGPDDIGVEIIDYGWEQGTPDDPVARGRLPNKNTHNFDVHPDADIVYAVNSSNPDAHLFDIFDVSDPSNPTLVPPKDIPKSDAHDLQVDPERDLLHVAVIGGELEGYVNFDISDPRNPELHGTLLYDKYPGYMRIGMAGFKNAHFVDFETHRNLVYVGDEIAKGVPGGKHAIDIGYGNGSPEQPVPIGFTHSPNAQEQGANEGFYWTGHNFDVINWQPTPLLASGDYHEGAVLYDISDPTEIKAIDRLVTTRGKRETNAPVKDMGPPPQAWGVYYLEDHDLGLIADKVTGAYTFELEPWE